MLPTVLNVKLNSNDELRNYTDNNMLKITNMYKIASEHELQEKVNHVLQKKDINWLEQIFDLLNKEEHRIVKGLSDDLIILSRLCRICKREYILKEQITLSKFSSLEEMKEIYQETTFYLRRIELGMDKEVCEDFLNFVKNWNFSTEYLLMVLEKGAIYDKLKTGGRLVQIFIENGFQEYGEQILEYLNAEEF